MGTRTIGGGGLTDDQVALLIRLRDDGGCLETDIIHGPDAIVLIAEGFASIENAVLCISDEGREMLRRRSARK